MKADIRLEDGGSLIHDSKGASKLRLGDKVSIIDYNWNTKEYVVVDRFLEILRPNSDEEILTITVKPVA